MHGRLIFRRWKSNFIGKILKFCNLFQFIKISTWYHVTCENINYFPVLIADVVGVGGVRCSIPTDEHNAVISHRRIVVPRRRWHEKKSVRKCLKRMLKGYARGCWYTMMLIAKYNFLSRFSPHDDGRWKLNYRNCCLHDGLSGYKSLHPIRRD